MEVDPDGVAVAEGVLFLVPEPKRPHGVDVTPDGEYIVVAGKLDPHVTMYSFQKIQDAIDRRRGKGRFGVPVLAYEACLEAQVEVGLGPLHTQFDDKGYGYTACSSTARSHVGSLADPTTMTAGSSSRRSPSTTTSATSRPRAATLPSLTATTSWRSTSGRLIGSRPSDRCCRRTFS